MAIIRCQTPAELLPVLAELARGQHPALLLFFGNEDPQTGQSWCPDCVTADPLLRRACRELRPDWPLYECPVGLRTQWKGQSEHPYRLHPQLRVWRIPTLIHLNGASESGRLVEADCAHPERIRAFLAPGRAATAGPRP